MSLAPMMFVMAATSALAASVMAWLWRHEGEAYLRLWSLAFGLQAVRYLVAGTGSVLGHEQALLPLVLISLLASGLVLLAGTLRYRQRSLHPASVVVGVLALLWVPVAGALQLGFIATTLPFFFFTGLVDMATGWVVLRSKEDSFGRPLAGWGFVLWGLHRMDYPFLRPLEWVAPWGFGLAIVFAITVSLGLILLHLDRARSRQRQSDSRYRDLVDHAIVGMYRTSTDGRFDAANPALVRMLGYDSLDEVLALEIPGDLTFGDEGGASLLTGEHRWRTKDGTPITVELHGRHLQDAGGGPGAFEGSVRNVTEARELQQRLLQAQKMEAVGQLAGGVAHDFNNLLMAIMGASDLAAEEVGTDQAGVRDHLATIHEAAERGAALTQQLLAFSSRQVVSPRRIVLSDALRQTERMLRRLIDETVSVQLVVEATPVVVADPVEIDQLVMNLAINARDAMPGGGALLIRLTAGGGHACIEVADDGEGMTPDVVSRIFEPFFTTKEVGRGTGLGLATVYGIVQQLGGTIDVESQPSVGTTFRIRLPVAEGPEARAAESPPATEPAPAARARVLLVEDDAEIRALLVRMLERAGHDVVAPSDTRAALAVLETQAHRFDLLVTDVVLPDARGPELADRYRVGQPQAPVVFMSGYPRDSAGAVVDGPHTRFLPKPFGPEALQSAVTELLEARASA